MGVDGGTRAKTQDSFLAIVTQSNIAINVVAATTIYTVPTGKVFVGHAYVFCATALTAGSTCAVRKTTNGLKGSASAVIATQLSFFDCGPLRGSAGDVFDFSVTLGVGTGTCVVSVLGEERFSE